MKFILWQCSWNCFILIGMYMGAFSDPWAYILLNYRTFIFCRDLAKVAISVKPAETAYDGRFKSLHSNKVLLIVGEKCQVCFSCSSATLFNYNSADFCAQVKYSGWASIQIWIYVFGRKKKKYWRSRRLGNILQMYEGFFKSSDSRALSTSGGSRKPVFHVPPPFSTN